MSAAAALMMGVGGPVYLSNNTAINQGNVNFPSGGSATNLIVAVAWSSVSPAATWAAGVATARANQGATPSLYIGDEVDGGSGSDTFTHTGSGTDAIALLRFINAQFDAVGSIATTTTDGTLTMPAITSAGGLVLAVCVCQQTGVTFTAPSGFSTILSTSISGMPVNICSKTVPPGSTGTIDTTVAGLSSGTAAAVLYGMK